MWMPIVLVAAVCAAARDSLNALRARDGAPTPFLNAWHMYAGGSLFLLAALPFVAFPGPRFWHAAAWSLPVEVVLQWLLFRALSLAQSSKVLPLMGLTPLVLYLYSFKGLTLGGGAGIGLIVVGITVITGGLKFCRGSLLMAGCAILCAVTNVFVVDMVTSDGPLVTAIWYNVATMVLLAPLALRESRRSGKPFVPRGWLEFGSSLLFLLGLSLTIFAMPLGPIAYINATKRASVVFAVLFGRRLGDDQFGRRLAGSLLIVAGVAVIGIFG